jgi:hypothetical protein
VVVKAALCAAVVVATSVPSPANAVLLPVAYGTYSRSHVTSPRPCAFAKTHEACSFSVTGMSGVYFDGGGHCSEVGSISGYLTLGCSVTLSVGATVDSTCTAVGEVGAEVEVASGVTGSSFRPHVTAVTWKNGVITFTANHVDASPTARVVHVTGSVWSPCALPAPAPESGQAWSFTGSFTYVD